MSRATRPPSRLRRATWLTGALVVAAVAFAPVTFSGFCADSVAASRSYCVTTARSLVGVETSLWLWLTASAVLAGFTWWLTRRRGRDL
ncbi:hypothetical protein JNB62_15415 [Microbacterium jejuense]|uniref:LPXTG-motif cell wall anchor domain-containing protein n=1 Tax=Microbacterium jejuense TaxID=1263637 RepID=A0ABS7HQ50_9MICO|nr:hypothetical protein [Microbacterium jejuense]MBW9095076.1 hypothetical protein [Microbacterium jejuense]